VTYLRVLPARREAGVVQVWRDVHPLPASQWHPPSFGYMLETQRSQRTCHNPASATCGKPSTHCWAYNTSICATYLVYFNTDVTSVACALTEPTARWLANPYRTLIRRNTSRVKMLNQGVQVEMPLRQFSFKSNFKL
jgi:hypothetical protein